MVKNYAIIVLNNIDPLVKKEIVYVVIGSSIGFLIGKLINRLDLRKFKKIAKEDPTLPKSKIGKRIIRTLRRLRGGQILEIIMAGNEVYTFIGGLAGLGGFLATLDKTQIYEFFKGSTMLKARELALMAPSAGVPVDKLKDVSCIAITGLDVLQKILEDDEIPFEEKKKVIQQFFKNLNLKKNKITFIFCMINLLLVLYFQKFSSYYLLLEKLRKMFLSGKISQVVYYAILRQLKKAGIAVDKEIEELIKV